MGSLFDKALRVVSVNMCETLLCGSIRWFLEQVWGRVRNELSHVTWTLPQFIDRVEGEARSRGWNIARFRGPRGESVLNLFKKLLREIAEDSDTQLSNDSLSRILNYIRNQYSTGGTLTAAMYPVRAFLERKEYDIDMIELGDAKSCFRKEGCNYGNFLWLKNEDEKYNRAKLIVFNYQSGSKTGFGRCWMYRLGEGAVFVTNFYSHGVELKASWMRVAVIEVLRVLADLRHDITFSTESISLPVVLNGDGFILYDVSKYRDSNDVTKLPYQIISQCMLCGKEFPLRDLCRFDEDVSYSGEEVSGLVVCKKCEEFLEKNIGA